MSKRQDRQGVRTPADVERKYNLGGLRDMMSRIAAEASGSEAVDALSKEVAALEAELEDVQVVLDLKEERVDLSVLKSRDKWFGVTYKEDKPGVVASVNELVKNGVYPEKLWD